MPTGSFQFIINILIGRVFLQERKHGILLQTSHFKFIIMSTISCRIYLKKFETNSVWKSLNKEKNFARNFQITDYYQYIAILIIYNYIYIYMYIEEITRTELWKTSFIFIEFQKFFKKFFSLIIFSLHNAITFNIIKFIWQITLVHLL